MIVTVLPRTRNEPRVTNASGPVRSTVPVNPRYHGVMGTGSSPRIRRCTLSAMTAGSKAGISVLHPVPMPDAPLTSSVGSTGA